MSKIGRGTGTTKTERVLTEIAEKSFLDLWTYPNLFRSQKAGANGKGDGKELCDLLVVCGDDVLIFSDKSINWNHNKPVDVAWSRWYRKAVDDSVKQIRGAERWLRDFPDRVFLDKDCTEPLPIELPPIERRRVYGVAIVDGAAEACRKHTGSPDGMLFVDSDVRGRDHSDPKAEAFHPFAIGDVDPDGPFVHVFDQQAIWVVLRLLDTILDFTQYLVRRADAIRSGYLRLAFGEDDLAAFYVSDIGPDGDHDFRRTDDPTPIVIEDGTFQHLVRRPEFLAKQEADQDSYFWDGIIRLFTTHILAGTSVTTADETGAPAPVLEAERGIRAMALIDRVHRRAMGRRIMDGYGMFMDRRLDKLARMAIIEPRGNFPRYAFVFFVLRFPSHFDRATDYDKYRETRIFLLALYCRVVLLNNPNVDMAVGIGVDEPSVGDEQLGSTEDLVTIEQTEWSDSQKQQIKEAQKRFDVLVNYTGGGETSSTDEYPVDQSAPSETRQQRRYRERQEKKDARRRR